MGLTNNQQAIAVFVSALFIALGAVTVPTSLPMWVKTAFFLIGAFGLAAKEALGDTSTGNSIVVPPDVIEAAMKGAIQAKSLQQQQIQLPPLPSGFSLQAASAANMKVYEDIKGNVILKSGTLYTNIFGQDLGQPDLTGFTLLN